ncbi:MAG: thiosulfate oxidation carrier complex protein SoxZ [Burkholderiales bacterium]|jgi:sulfur-oxidizing protein SoxZ|nr:thiosulfate oxidation carrier complex protein SoxZ [Burkholderiales bacterium]
MADTIKMRITLEGDTAFVKVLMPHPMETGLRTDPKTNELVPKHFIQHVVATHNGRPVLDAQWSQAVSKNPFLEFRVRGAKPGDKIGVAWEDNRGENNALEVAIK